MKRGGGLWARVALMLAVTLAGLGGLAARAEEPAVTAAKGQCIAPKPVMRRVHMDMLKHDRTAAVHQGLRPGGHMLENCVSCHAVAGSDGKPVPITDDRHFCNSCHRSVAVSLDCFSCHRSTPPPAAIAERGTP